MQKRLNLNIFLSVVFCLFFSLLTANSQELRAETVVVNGKNYYDYTVRTGEGLYAVSRAFSVSVAELIRNNPGSEKGLQNGQSLLIPVNDENQKMGGASLSPTHTAQSPIVNQSILGDQNTTFQHTVVLGETVYGIANMYHTTVEEINRLNPSAKDGISEGQVLVIPQRRVISQEKEENYRYHTILPKETLYSVSRTYSLKPEDVMRANAGLSSETFQIGKTIRIPFFESYEVVLPYEQQRTNIVHKVGRGETLYSIAKQYEVQVSDIQQANPMLENGLKTNMELLIPVLRNSAEESSANLNQANNLLRQSLPAEQVNVIKVGLLLPFLDETRGAHLRLQEYYEGFVMAVHQLKNSGANIELYVFDSGKGSDTKKLQSLLGTMEMQSLNLIVGGVSDAQIKVLSDFALSNKIKYVVPFSQSNEEVLNNGNIFQVNPIPFQTYTKASTAFINTYRNANVVFVKGSGKDQSEFATLLQTSLRKQNIKFETIQISSTLESEMRPLLSTSSHNVIVPVSGDATLLRQLMDELKKTKEASPDISFRLFGYPDWQAYTNLKADYNLFDTQIFAPFFTNGHHTDNATFQSSFRKWYGRDLLETYPNYGMWGYDTGLYFLTALHRYGHNFEQNIDRIRVQSLQFPFMFERPNNWGGFINTGLFFVNYSTDGRIVITDQSR